MSQRVLGQELLNDKAFWRGKNVLLPRYDRLNLPIRSIAFSAGRMAYGHTGDILQDILNQDPNAGLIAGVKTHSLRTLAELANSDYLMAQLIYENQPGVATAKIQGAFKTVLMADADPSSLGWQRLLELARDPQVQFATINAPEGAYGIANGGGAFASPLAATVKRDMVDGTVQSDPGKWTRFALERFKANLPFAMVSCTNFSENGQVTGATVRMMAQAWEEKGTAPKGFVAYLSDPKRFAFPNTMIDRIAVAPDAAARAAMEAIGVRANPVVTERVRYWAVEDRFPAGRPPFEAAEGVFLCPDLEDVKRYESMKLRLLNMSHSTIAGLGVLLGYRGPYGIFRAMQDPDIRALIDRILDIVVRTIERPQAMDPRDFARDTIARLNNPNIPDDPMRIALNGSTKMKVRFLDTYGAGQRHGLLPRELAVVLLPVAGFLRYLVGVDDQGATYALEDDPLKSTLAACGAAARLGDPASSVAFKALIANPDVMGADLYGQGGLGLALESLVGRMLEGQGAVRATLVEGLK